MLDHAVIAIIIFIAVYGAIVSEKIHRTKAALFGAALVIVFNILGQEAAVHKIDFNTIGLLVGMMIIVAVTQHTGLFQYLAIWAAKKVKGDPLKIMLAFFVLTAVASAFLDNVTTVLLMTSITFGITNALGINPIPILIAEIFASNIGGTATLIGDPPNIMIGSATGLGFMDFVVNLTPAIAIITIVTMYLFAWLYRKDLVTSPERQASIMRMDEKEYIKDPVLMKRAIAVIAVTIAGFVLHQVLGYESATIALSGAALLLLISGKEPEHILREVEWNTIFFFIGLFIVVGGLEETGTIAKLAKWAVDLTHGNLMLTGMLILWLSAIASAFVDNIPFVATMIPLIKAMGSISGIDVSSLWWALSLGACLGGNGTQIGASANVVVSGIAEQHGHPISFMGYLKVGFPMMLVSIVLSTIYLLMFYF